MRKLAHHHFIPEASIRRDHLTPGALPTWLLASFAVLCGLMTLPYLRHGLVLFDDGVYAWMAGRIEDGAILHKDIQSSHPGYQQLLHGLLYRIFGTDILTLRYPLPLLAAANAALAMQLFRRVGALFQISAASITAGLSFLLFNNPSTNWTCLTISLAIAKLIQSNNARPTSGNLLSIGILLGLCGGIRHPTAALLGMATVTAILLNEPKQQRPSWSSLLSSALPLLTFLAVAVCSFSSGMVWDRLLWAAPALLLCAIALTHSIYIEPKPLLLRCSWILLGSLVGITPLIWYLIENSAWTGFVSDLAESIKLGSTYSQSLGSTFSNLILEAITIPSNASQILCCGVVALLTFSPAALCMYIASKRPFSNPHISTDKPIPPIIIVAAFYALVAMVLPGEIYLAFVAAPLALALLSAASDLNQSKTYSTAICSIGIAIGMIGFFGMSGNMAGGTAAGIYGFKENFRTPCPLPKCDLLLSTTQASELADVYSRVAAAIPVPNDLIGIPSGHALNFFTNRKGDPSLIFPRATFGENGAIEASKEISSKPCVLVLREKNAGRAFDQELAKNLKSVLIMVDQTPKFELLRNSSIDCTQPSEPDP